MPHHPWIARFSVSAIMIVLSFIGLVLTNIRASGGWVYWQVVVVIFALSALWLSWYLHRKKETLSPVTLWHEVLHWIGLIGAVFLITFLVQNGLLGRFEASLSVLTMTALAIYLAGIYIESWFLYTGIALGLFVAIVAFIEEYLYALSIPLLLVSLGILAYVIRHKHKKKTPTI